MRHIIRLSYDGSDFCGWQIQPDVKSVQGCLQVALSTLLGMPTEVTGAGRTDTEVNAVNYLAHFDAPGERLNDVRNFCYKLNAILPHSIVVHEVLKASSEDFHARFGAKSRQYRYFVHRHRDPFIRNWSYLFDYPTLNVESMNQAAALLLGTHDFACFQKKGSDVKTSICTVTQAGWMPYTPDHLSLLGYTPSDGRELKTPCRDGNEDFNYLVFSISADRFLRNMVRAIVGTLLDIGRGKHDVSWIEEVLNSQSRSFAGESVPGNALFLSRVTY